MTHDRETLAATAARMIVESQLTDWSLARRKALDHLGLSLRAAALPSDDEIIAEIKTYHSLYGGEEHAEQIAAQRETAIDVMRALARFDPRLVGAVAEGWAHEGSDIVIDIAADSSKDVEIELVNLGADIDAREARDGTMHLRIEDADWPIRVIVRPYGRPPDARYKTRLNSQQVKQLMHEYP
jgi:hypothetical protein